MGRKMHGIAASHKGTGSIIGTGVIFESATLKGSGVVRIDGEFNGTIDFSGHIVLGENGIINGDVHADTALFAGKYRGNLRIRDILHVVSTADLSGKIDSAKIIIDEGAKISGECNVAKGNPEKSAAGAIASIPTAPNATGAIASIPAAPKATASIPTAPKTAASKTAALEATAGKAAARTAAKTAAGKAAVDEAARAEVVID